MFYIFIRYNVISTNFGRLMLMLLLENNHFRNVSHIWILFVFYAICIYVCLLDQFKFFRNWNLLLAERLAAALDKDTVNSANSD